MLNKPIVLLPIPPPSRFLDGNQKEYENDTRKDIFRFVNVSKYLDDFIIKHNNEHEGNEGMSYLSFKDDCTHRQRNTRAKNIIASLLNKHLPDDFGTRTYCQSLAVRPREMENLIELASQNASLSVFSQTENHWAIRKLIEERMATRKRSEDARNGHKSEEKAKHLHNCSGGGKSTTRRVEDVHVPIEKGVSSKLISKKPQKSFRVNHSRSNARKNKQRNTSSSRQRESRGKGNSSVTRNSDCEESDQGSFSFGSAPHIASSSSDDFSRVDGSEEEDIAPVKRSRKNSDRTHMHSSRSGRMKTKSVRVSKRQRSRKWISKAVRDAEMD